MMFKRKHLWIIPIIVALVAVAGVFAAPSPMPGADQGGVALAQQPDEIPGVVYKTANGGHWHSSPEQIEQINKLLEENPDITTGEVFKQVVSELYEVMSEAMRNSKYIIPNGPPIVTASSIDDPSVVIAKSVDDCVAIDSARDYVARSSSGIECEYPNPVEYWSETEITPHDAIFNLEVRSYLDFKPNSPDGAPWRQVDSASYWCNGCYYCKASDTYHPSEIGDFRVRGWHNETMHAWSPPPPWYTQTGEYWWGPDK